MMETLIVAVMGMVGPIIGAIISLKSLAYKSKREIQQKDFESKREHLDTVYKRLISIINLYPNSSPNDVLKWVEYPPNYLMEWFDATLKTLDYQMDDYRKRLENKNIDYELKSNIETQIANREYAKKRISEIEKDYFKAKEEYKKFCTSDKIIFDLYAGQNVKNSLVEF